MHLDLDPQVIVPWEAEVKVATHDLTEEHSGLQYLGQDVLFIFLSLTELRSTPAFDKGGELFSDVTGHDESHAVLRCHISHLFYFAN